MRAQVSISGVSLEVERIAGSNTQAPIFFLHEGLGSVAMWREFPAQLCAATGRSGLVYSRRGYGHSSAVSDVRGAGRLQADYMHHEAWQVLPALLSELGIEKPVLLGHSDGGTIALLYAAQFDCEACVVMAPHLFVEQKAIDAIAAAGVAFQTTDLRSKLAKYHADVDGAFWQWNDVWLSQAFRSFNIEAECAQIRCPVLAIQGHEDTYGTMAQLDRLINCLNGEKTLSPAYSLTSLLLKLEQCGHSPHKDQPAAVIAAVQRFLTR
jgi:pimeloyl-ACP methyl ester carboxylesterase